MSVISLQCPNCRARLKAKAAAIGQSLACPRCANMIVVTAEKADAEKADAEVRSPASFESDSLDELLNSGSSDSSTSPGPKRAASPAKTKRQKPEKTPRHPEDLQVTKAHSSESLADSKTSGSPSARSSDGQRGSRRKPDTDPSIPKADGQPEAESNFGARPGQWQSRKAKQQKTILLGLILGIGTLLSGSALVYYVLTSNSNGQLAEVPPPAKDPVPEDSDASDPEVMPDENSTTDASDGPATPDGDGNSSPPDTAQDSSDSDGDAGIENVPPDNAGPTNPSNSSSEETTATPDDPETSGASDPPEPSQETLEDAINQIFADDEIFQQEFLGGPGEQESNAGPESPFGKVNIDDTSVMRRPSARYQRPAPRMVDAPRQLETELAGMRHEAVTVPQLIAILERLSSVPIWIDGPAYRASPVDLEQSFALQAIKQTPEAILSEHLNPLGLSFDRFPLAADNASAIGIRLFPNGGNEPVERNYRPPGQPGQNVVLPTPEPEQSEPSDDPTPDQPDPLNATSPTEPPPPLPAPAEKDPAAVGLASLVQQYVAPGQWVTTPDAPDGNAANGPSLQVVGQEIRVTARPAIHYRIQRLREQLTFLNNADGPVPPQSPELRPMALQAQAAFAAPLRLDFYRPTALRTVLDGFTQQSGLVVIVDWPALLGEGWTPDTEVPWSANSESTKSALDEFVFDMGLTYQLVTPTVIRLTTREAVNRDLDVEVYAIGDLVADQERWDLLRSRLSQLLYVELRDYPQSYVNYYADQDCVIASLPQEGHRRLTEYFTQLRNVISQQP